MACWRVRRTRRSTHSEEPAPSAAPVTNQKVRRGMVSDPPFDDRRIRSPQLPSDPDARRRIPVAAPARTARTLTTGLAKAR